MFSLIKDLFVVLLSFSDSLTTRCLFLIDQRRMVIPTLIDMSTVEPIYYPFMISLNKGTGSCYALSTKIIFQKKQNT